MAIKTSTKLKKVVPALVPAPLPLPLTQVRQPMQKQRALVTPVQANKPQKPPKLKSPPTSSNGQRAAVNRPVDNRIAEKISPLPPPERQTKLEIVSGRHSRRRRHEKDEQALKEMARRHLSYEVKMLRELADALQGKGVGPRTLRNALLESFLIHYRNLYDFFYPDFPTRRRLPDDICAGDYLHNPKRWRKHRPDTNEKQRQNRERVNALLAHLTLRRLKYRNRSWHDRKMAGIIEELLQEFLRELPRERRTWFRAVIAKKPVIAEHEKPQIHRGSSEEF
jgi:hypothetical protein